MKMALTFHQGIQEVRWVLHIACLPPSPGWIPKNQTPRGQQGHKLRELGLLNHRLARQITDQKHPHWTVNIRET